MKRIILTWPLLIGLLVHLAAAQSWTPNGPLPRYGHSAVFDPSTRQMIIFGGFSGAIGQNLDADVWRLLPAASLSGVQNWVALHPIGTLPPGRGGHVAGYDPASNRMVTFGGQTAAGCVNDVWVLTNANGHGGSATWSQLTPLGGPPESREYFGSAYDPVSNTLMVYGGYDCQTSAVLDDYWILSNANGLGGTPTWTELPTGLGGPGPRYGQTAVYDPSSNELILFAGLDGQRFGIYSDVWVITNANGIGGYPAWEELSAIGQIPDARFYSSAIYDVTNNVMTIFGGAIDGGTGFCTWFCVLTYANGVGGVPTWFGNNEGPLDGPGNDAQHTAVYDASRNAMIVFGGSGPNNNVFSTSVN